MPLFCRHNRFEATCPICSKDAGRSTSPVSPRTRTRSTASGSGRKSGGMVTRKLARATEDGYRNDLVPGIKATADAERLAAALTFAVDALEQRPELDFDEAAELAFGSPDAIKGWSPPAESAAWTPQKRFARWFDRLRPPGTTRGQRYAFLVALGPARDLEPEALYFDTKGNDPTTLAAKRALNSGDAMLLDRRARTLAEAAGVPIAALDQAFALWDGREPLPDEADDRVRAALGLEHGE